MLSLERTVMARAKDRLQEPQRQGVSQSLCSELTLTTTHSFGIFGFFFAQIPQSYVTYIDSLVLLFSHSVVSDSLPPIACSTPDFPVLQYLPEFAHTHVYRINDAIQPSHLLSSPSPAFNLSQHQGLFQ